MGTIIHHFEKKYYDLSNCDTYLAAILTIVMGKEFLKLILETLNEKFLVKILPSSIFLSFQIRFIYQDFSNFFHKYNEALL